MINPFDHWQPLVFLCCPQDRSRDDPWESTRTTPALEILLGGLPKQELMFLKMMYLCKETATSGIVYESEANIASPVLIIVGDSVVFRNLSAIFPAICWACSLHKIHRWYTHGWHTAMRIHRSQQDNTMCEYMTHIYHRYWHVNAHITHIMYFHSIVFPMTILYV